MPIAAVTGERTQREKPEWGQKEATAAQIQSLQQEVFGLVAIMFAVFAFELTLADFVATSSPPRSFSAGLALGALSFADGTILLSLLAVMARYDLIYALVRKEEPWPTSLQSVRQSGGGAATALAEKWFAIEDRVFYGVDVPETKFQKAGRLDLTAYRHFLVLFVALASLISVGAFVLIRCAPYSLGW